MESLRLAFAAGTALMAAFFAVSAVGAALLRKSSAPAAARLCRSRKVGLPLAAVVLWLCARQAEPIVWEWLARWLMPLAAAALLLAWKYLDYLASRAAAGLIIIAAYLFVNAGYALHLPALAPGAAAAYCWAVFGMYVSACPYRLRDLLWCACGNVGVRLTLAGLCAGTALYLAWATVETCLR